MLELYSSITDLTVNIDHHIIDVVGRYKTWTYVILFVIIFAETGLIVAPFLPGDSLLFAAGAIIARDGAGLNIVAMLVILIIAAITGDAVNYAIGKRVRGSKIFDRLPLLKTGIEKKASRFYQTHGGKALIYARFIPILRTFAPFFAGTGQMPYRNFLVYNIVGAILWVTLFLLLGYFFGATSLVHQHFVYVTILLILMSFLPPTIELTRRYILSRQRGQMTN
jgi:membrane-associated protein